MRAHQGWTEAYDRARTTIINHSPPDHLAHIPRGVDTFFSNISWDVPIGPFLSIRHLSPLFSNDPLNEDILNGVVNLLQEWAAKSEQSNRSIYIETVANGSSCGKAIIYITKQ